MDFVIDPFVSVGPIAFGMPRQDVRAVLNAPVETFMRNEDDEAETDEFERLGVYVEYDKDDLCIAVELFSPAKAIFRERDLLSEPYAQVRKWLESLDSDADVDESGIVSEQLGVGVSADLPKRDKRSPAESVIGFKRGYYDD